MTLASRILEWRCRKARSLLARCAYAQLEGDLSACTTTRDRLDLSAQLDRCAESQSRDVRTVLDGQQVARGSGLRMVAGLPLKRW